MLVDLKTVCRELRVSSNHVRLVAEGKPESSKVEGE